VTQAPVGVVNWYERGRVEHRSKGAEGLAGSLPDNRLLDLARNALGEPGPLPIKAVYRVSDG